SARAEVTARRTGRGVAIEIDRKLFTEYLIEAGHAPAMWPVIGPTGKPVTRGYPFTPAPQAGTKDHPPHESLWFIHDDANGVGFWRANVHDDKGYGGPHIAHREFAAIDSGGRTARIVTRNDWMDGDARICEDERNIVFGQNVGSGGDDARWIDFTITIK